MRVFVGIELGAATRAALPPVLAALADAGFRASAAADLHLTLAFIGELDDARLPLLASTLRAVAAATTPFTITLGGLGAFPRASAPRVVFVDVAAGRAPLDALAARTRESLRAAGVSFDDKPFVPHVTVARARGARSRHAAAPPVEVEDVVTELVLFESHRGPDGRYRAVSRHALSAPSGADAERDPSAP